MKKNTKKNSIPKKTSATQRPEIKYTAKGMRFSPRVAEEIAIAKRDFYDTFLTYGMTPIQKSEADKSKRRGKKSRVPIIPENMRQSMVGMAWELEYEFLISKLITSNPAELARAFDTYVANRNGTEIYCYKPRVKPVPSPFSRTIEARMLDAVSVVLWEHAGLLKKAK